VEHNDKNQRREPDQAASDMPQEHNYTLRISKLSIGVERSGKDQRREPDHAASDVPQEPKHALQVENVKRGGATLCVAT
jgi:hypothetical protein